MENKKDHKVMVVISSNGNSADQSQNNKSEGRQKN